MDRYKTQPDPVTSVQQHYAESTDYFECYGQGSGFVTFRSPDTLDHRYLHEDAGMGLVLYCKLGEQLDVPTPTSRAVVGMATAITGVDYFAQPTRTPQTLGLGGMDPGRINAFLESGE